MVILGYLTREFAEVEVEVLKWKRSFGNALLISSESFDDVSLYLDENHNVVLSYTDSEDTLQEVIIKEA